jgi:hypothetical protein
VRLIVAIVLLAVSTLSLATVITQQILMENPESIELVIDTDSQAPATIIHGSELSAFPGRPSITITGGDGSPSPTSPMDGVATEGANQVFIAYGRTIDVMAWLSPARHTQLRVDGLTPALTALPRSGYDIRLPNPVGSDLWIQEFIEIDTVTLSASIPEDVSVLIMSDGTLPAPNQITVSWPLVNQSPWTIVLFVIGIGTLVAGVVLLFIHYALWRTKRGPRRKLTKRPRHRPQRARAPKRSSLQPRGRRRMRLVAAPVAGLVMIAVVGCQSVEPAPETTVDPLAVQDPAAQAPYPSVTELQFSRIMGKVAQQIQLADEELSVNTLGIRVTEPTLEGRRAAYIVRRADPESGVLIPIQGSPIRLVLPQQTQTWPRTVFGIIQDEQDLESPSFGVVLRQEDPRSPYLLSYAIVLAPQVQLPDLPSARVGSAKLSADSKLTKITPSEVVSHYADVINQGSQSAFANEFALATDSLFGVIGPDAEALRQESFGESVEVSWLTSPLERDIVAFATTDGGAIVMGVVQEVETVKPRQQGAAVNASLAVRALTSLSQSLRGFDVQSNIQILFYVPPIGSEEGIRVLGYTYSVVGAKEVDSE